MSPVPAVSVIVPVFNVERYLGKCLESVLSQSLENIEVICTDDGSSDRSPEILAEYAAKDPRVKTIFHGKNLGTNAARKHAVAASSGEYVMFLDADDEFAPDACLKACDAIKKHNVDILQFGAEIVDATDNMDLSGLSGYFAQKHTRVEGDLVKKCWLGGKQRAFNWSLWNKIVNGDIARLAYSQTTDEFVPRANDLYAFFFIARISRSYMGIPDKLYRCNRGAGLYGTTFHSLETFRLYLTQKRTVDLLREFCRKNGEEEKYEEVLSHLETTTRNNCLDRWLNDLVPEESGAGFERLIATFGVDDVICGLASRYWKRQADVARKAATGDYFLRRSRRTGRSQLAIAFYYGSITDGGGQRVTARLCNMLAEATDAERKPLYRVILITDDKEQENEYPLSPLVSRRFLPCRQTVTGNSFRERYFAWKKILDEDPVDIVVSGYWFDAFSLWDMLAVKIHASRPAFLLYIHSFTARPFIYADDSALRLTDVYRIADGIFVLSECDRAYVSRYARHVVCGVNPIFAPKISENVREREPHAILWTGRIVDIKRPLDLVLMMKRLVSDVPDAKLYIVGDDKSAVARKLVEKVRVLGLSENVILTGFTADVAHYLARASVYVCTSEYEGFPMSIGEALSFGVPVVMYDLPWLTFVQDGRGIVPVPHGRYDVMAKEVARLLTCDDERERLSAEGMKQIKDMAAVNLVEIWGKFFREITEDAYDGKSAAVPASRRSRTCEDILFDHIVMYQEVAKQSLRKKVAVAQKAGNRKEPLVPLSVPGRIDITNLGNTGNDVELPEISDGDAKQKPITWIKSGGGGVLIESSAGSLTLQIKCIGEGKLKLALRGRDVRGRDKRRIPEWVDYTSLRINGATVFKGRKAVWHDRPFRVERSVKDGEVVSVSTSWERHEESLLEHFVAAIRRTVRIRK